MQTITKPAEIGTVSPAVIRRVAFYLPSQGHGLFAWLHFRDPAPRLDHGVVICPPIGYEQIHSHRSLRHLADALARAGFYALRFDYHGTGDSPGTDDEPDRLATWICNIRDAQAWLRRHCGCQQLSAIGLRLGATLAVQAAAELPIEQLVLWAPVVKGRTYVREMKALGLAALNAGAPAPRTADDLEAGGFVLNRQTVGELQQLDLLQNRPQCERVLLVSRDDLSPESRLPDHLTARGIAVDSIAPPGYTDMMAEPHANHVPHPAIAAITNWLRAASATPSRSQTERTPMPAPRTATGVSAGEPAAGVSGVRERIVCLREQPHLFGIVSEPAEGSPAALPTVLLVNAGSAYRVAPSRLYVLLARALAARGFRCLRLDLGGLGDSASPHPDYENHPYPPTMFSDIDFAIRHLQAREGADRVVLLGLCSGAYAAFQSAVHCTNPALVECLMMNPLAFYWREGMPINTSSIVRLSRVHYLRQAALNPRKWLALLSGRTTLGFTGLARLVLQHWRWQLRGGGVPQRSTTEPQSFENGHPVREDLPADLVRATRAGRRLAFFFGTRDPSHRILMFHARRKVRQLVRYGALSMSFIDGADHTFTERAPREVLVRSVCEYLVERYRDRAEATGPCATRRQVTHPG
jgi:alpha-beta hydrolase superfamily lysophospholipase